MVFVKKLFYTKYEILILIIALIEQFPDLNQTLLDKYEKKIKLNFQKRKLGRQADDAADYTYVSYFVFYYLVILILGMDWTSKYRWRLQVLQQHLITKLPST